MPEENIKTRDFGNIYRLIYEKKQCSRQQIAEELGISLPTITHNLALLKEQELIYTSGTFNSTGGRKANMFRCVPNARYALGIDIWTQVLIVRGSYRDFNLRQFVFDCSTSAVIF